MKKNLDKDIFCRFGGTNAVFYSIAGFRLYF